MQERRKKVYTSGSGVNPANTSNSRYVVSRVPPKTLSEKGFVWIRWRRLLHTQDGWSSLHENGMKYGLWFSRENDTIITDETLKELYLKDMFITNIWEVLLCLYKTFLQKTFLLIKAFWFLQHACLVSGTQL